MPCLYSVRSVRRGLAPVALALLGCAGLWTVGGVRAQIPLIEGRPLTAAERQEAGPHTEWVVRTLKRIQTIQPGNTRAQLLQVFTTEGGVSSANRRLYVYRTCPQIKVEVEFRLVGKPHTESSGDVITRISKPFLDWTIAD